MKRDPGSDLEGFCVGAGDHSGPGRPTHCFGGKEIKYIFLIKKKKMTLSSVFYFYIFYDVSNLVT
jgi:hypothetical protein